MAGFSLGASFLLFPSGLFSGGVRLCPHRKNTIHGTI
jgi:hypothetical protein